MELYPFSSIKSLKENDVRFWTLFEKCTMACCAIFYKNQLTFVVSNPNFNLFFPFSFFLDSPISLIYMLLQFFDFPILFYFSNY
jgi:hypothetical protein